MSTVPLKEDVHEKNKYIKKGNSIIRDPKQHAGNSMGLKASRPQIKGLRQFKTMNNEKEVKCANPDVVLCNAAPNIKGLCNLVDLDSKGQCNPQPMHSSRRASHASHALHAPKVVLLDQIHPKLYVANFEYASTLSLSTLSTIINVSRKEISTTDGVHVHCIKYFDNDQTTYSEFKQIINRAMDIMTTCDLENRNIYLVCDKGVNRSVSIAVAYAILKNKMTFIEARDYIDKEKAKIGYSSWDSLTNSKINNFLTLLSQ